MTGGGIGRRTAARRIALHALAPIAALAIPVGRAAAGTRPIATPAGNFRLERVLVRGLSGGAEIVVTRHWQIGFAPTRGGMAVSGEQVHAAVAAPPRLAELAEIERTRSTASLFPILLDSAGLIQRDVTGRQGGDEAAFQRALDYGRALLGALTLTAAEGDDARSFVAKLSNMSAGAVSRLPQDLFFPRPGEETTSRDLTLPGGETGSITVTALTRAAPVTGLLDVVERRIVTRVADSERTTFERWALARL